jgi:hypothetical protein
VSDPRHTNVPHPFWGDPPDVETCETWMGIVLGTYENLAPVGTFAKIGGRVTDEHGRVLSAEEYAAWVKEHQGKRHRAMQRYRWLKAWRQQHLQLQATPIRARELSQQGKIHGSLFKGALRRYGKLERLYEAAVVYVNDDTDESWTAFLVALDELEKGSDTDGNDR